MKEFVFMNGILEGNMRFHVLCKLRMNGSEKGFKKQHQAAVSESKQQGVSLQQDLGLL